MIYRVRAELAFTDIDEAQDFYHDCQLAIVKSSTINENMIDEEKGFIQIEECTHAEDKTAPCTSMASQTT